MYLCAHIDNTDIKHCLKIGLNLNSVSHKIGIVDGISLEMFGDITLGTCITC